MSLDQYLGLGRKELFMRKIEFLIGVLLKTISHYFINKDLVKKHQAINDQYDLIIVIIVRNKYMAKQPIASVLRFRSIVKKVENIMGGQV